MDHLLAQLQELQQGLEELLPRCEKLKALVDGLDERSAHLALLTNELVSITDEATDKLAAVVLEQEQIYLANKKGSPHC